MIQVRPARAGEEAELAEVGLASWRKGIKPHMNDAVAARIEAQNPFIPFIRQLGTQILVAEYQGKAAGIGASEHGDNQISDIWVAPEFEGLGAGSLLIRALERQIADRGFAEAFIHVTAANGRALGLYRHLGYRDVWQRSEFDPILEATLEKNWFEEDILALLRGGFSPRSQLALFSENGMTPGIIIISST